MLFASWLPAATNFVFVHHSVGEGWLSQGGLSAYLTSAGFNVHDTDYGDAVPGTPAPGHEPIGDFTDVNDWYWWFHNHIDGLLGWECSAGESNKIVMFKSCYPNSAIAEEGTAPGNPTNDNATMWNYRAAYCSLTNVFAAYSNVFFIPVTAPPMRPGDGYHADIAARGRAFDNWLRDDYIAAYVDLTGLRNVAVFDLLDILATPSTKPRGANALARAYRTRDSHPNAKGGRAATGAFLPFLRNALRYWATGAKETNAFLKAVKAKVKTSSGMLKLKACVDGLGTAPANATIIIGTNTVQTFSTFTSRGKSQISKVTAANGKKALLKLINKREPRIIMKVWLTDTSARPLALKIDLGNGHTYAIDLIPDNKGRFP